MKTSRNRSHSFPPIPSRPGNDCTHSFPPGALIGPGNECVCSLSKGRVKGKRRRERLPLFNAWPPLALGLPTLAELERLSKATEIRDRIVSQGGEVMLGSELTPTEGAQ